MANSLLKGDQRFRKPQSAGQSERQSGRNEEREYEDRTKAKRSRGTEVDRHCSKEHPLVKWHRAHLVFPAAQVSKEQPNEQLDNAHPRRFYYVYVYDDYCYWICFPSCCFAAKVN